MEPKSVQYRQFTLLVCGVVVVIGIAVCIGWILDIPMLKSILPNYASMKFNAAIGFILIGSALFIYVINPIRWAFHSKILAFAVITLGVLSFSEGVFNFNLQIDEFFIPDEYSLAIGQSNPGRMAYVTAVCFVLMGSSVMLVNWYSNQLLPQILLHFVTLLSFIAIMGYLFSVPAFYTLSFLSAMPVHSATSFFILSIAASLLNPSVGVTGLFTGNKIGNFVARKLFVQMVLVILILSYVRILIQRSGMASPEFAIVLFGISFILISLFLIGRMSRRLNSIDSKKEEAENSLSKAKTFLDSTPDPIIIVDSKGIIRLVNNQVSNVFGYTREELMGQNIELLMPQRFTAQHTNHLANYFAIPKVRAMGSGLELFAKRKDGTEFHVEISLSPIKSPDGVYVSAAVRDVSDRKKIELELKESNERNKIFVQQSPNAIAMFDREMCYMAASDKWLEDYQLTGTEIIGRCHYEIFPEINEDWKRIHQDSLKGNIHKRDEELFERTDGSVQWLSWEVRPWYISKGVVGGILIYTNDITESKLRDYEKRRVDHILEQSSKIGKIATWEVDLQKDQACWSDLACEIFEVPKGFQPDRKTTVGFYKKGEKLDQLLAAIKASNDHGTPYDVEAEIISGKGNHKWIRIIGEAEFRNGVCIKRFGIFQDITKSKKAEQDLQFLTEKLISQNSQLNNFAHTISHNLRSPVSNLRSLLLLLNNSTNDNDKELYLSKFDTVVQHLSSTLDSLLEILKTKDADHNAHETLSFKDVLFKTMELISEKIAESNAQITYDFDRAPKITYNRSYLESIFLNLLTNAIKYSSKKRIPEIRLSTEYSNGRLTLTVRDNGLGIDLRRYGKKLFGLNKTFHQHAEAKGVGLFLTKNQVESLGGTITVDSEVDEGTTFTIIFGQSHSVEKNPESQLLNKD